ncbi:MAG TPA: DUF2690 domain-containing protein [Pilimelia sp.]|nr:DUF2690 domain-containing protein [Pilimelia sp.]
MDGRRRRRIWLVLVAAVGLVSLVLPAQPAAAAPCWYSTCNGKDPSVTGCSAADAETEREFTTGRFRVELRYSFGCRAGWARATSRYVSLGSDTRVGIDAGVVNPDGSITWKSMSSIILFPDALGEQEWTRMIGSYSSTYTYYGAFRAWQCDGHGSPPAQATYELCRTRTPDRLSSTGWAIPRNN